MTIRIGADGNVNVSSSVRKSTETSKGGSVRLSNDQGVSQVKYNGGEKEASRNNAELAMLARQNMLARQRGTNIETARNRSRQEGTEFGQGLEIPAIQSVAPSVQPTAAPAVQEKPKPTSEPEQPKIKSAPVSVAPQQQEQPAARQSRVQAKETAKSTPLTPDVSVEDVENTVSDTSPRQEEAKDNKNELEKNVASGKQITPNRTEDRLKTFMSKKYEAIQSRDRMARRRTSGLIKARNLFPQISPEEVVEEVAEETPENIPEEAPEQPASPRNKPFSKIDEARRQIDSEVGDGTRTQYVSPSDLQASIDNDLDNATRVAENNRLREIRDRDPSYYEEKQEVERPDTSNLFDDQDDPLFHWQYIGTAEEVEGMSDERKLEIIENAETKRKAGIYNLIRETLTSAQARSGDFKRSLYDTAENIYKAYAEARDEIKMRLVNPFLVRIESEHVETKTRVVDGETRVFARKTYSDRVFNAIQSVRTLYNCSMTDVLRLVICRAGLGVDLKGLIGRIKSREFRLSDSQFVELCHDIEISQAKYGHPMALVNGVSNANNVRTKSGKYVIVAGTRCFPLGYLPESLIRNISSSEESTLYGLTVGEIQTMIGNEWRNRTYPDLLDWAKEEDNVIWQARSIENMMRAVISIDKIVDPAMLDIPEVKVNRTMMQMVTERELALDPAIIRANEERERRAKEDNDRMLHMFRKRNGGRDSDGTITSPARRRTIRSTIGDAMGTISNWSKMAKVADVFLLITNPVEALMAMSCDNIGAWIMKHNFERRHQDIAENYKMTDQLAIAASRKETIEAVSVLESLYRIAGWTAINAFLGPEDGGTGWKYHLTNQDLRRFLEDMGVIGPKIMPQVLAKFGIKPNEEKAFIFNVRGVIDGIDNLMLGTGGLFEDKEAQQFVELCMIELGRAAINGEESYTNAEVEEWAARGKDEMIRGLISTQAGQEAFMTQGVSGLGRKSPYEFAVRQLMTRNRLVELTIRTSIDRFVEYGITKIMTQVVPYSNTVCYLASYGIQGIGDILSMGITEPVQNAGAALGRVGDYQMGRRLSFFEGLRKNLMYDTILGTNRLVIGCLYYGVIKSLGGVMPPKDEDKNLYTWSEWRIGGQLPLKWAWFMDDLSGIGLPFGVMLAIIDYYDMSVEGTDVATKVFINAVANFNSGTAVFDVIDLFNNFDEEMAEAMGNNEEWIEASDTEKRNASIELMMWKLLGDLTPTVVKQLVPWSRDFLLRDDYMKRTAAKVYDTSDGRSIEDAEREYEVKSVDDYRDYMRRKEALNNPIGALIMDKLFKKENETGYMFTEQPIKTEADPLGKATWDKYDAMWQEAVRGKRTPEELKQASRAYAEAVCQQIEEDYEDPTDALTKGFVLPIEARLACQEYCQYMMYDEIGRQKSEELNRLREQMGMQYLPDDIYQKIEKTYDNMFDHYKMLYDYYFSGSSEIPWKLTRYAVLDSDTETRYVNDSGQLGTYVDYALGLNGIHPETYSYGNVPTPMPFYSPQETGGFSFESLPYWVRYDEDGNLRTDINEIYELIDGMTDSNGQPLRDKLFGDRGPDSIPTLGKRGLIPLEQTLPKGFKEYYDSDQTSRMLGFDAFDRDKVEDESDDEENQNNKEWPEWNKNKYPYNNRYPYNRYPYKYNYKNNGYNSAYMPKIYSSDKSVYGPRAASISVQRPYSATTTYLRPGFSTKGSREAFERSDI